MAQSTTETPVAALVRIRGMGFGKNDALVVMEFSHRGIPPEDINPRVNVLTFNAWKGCDRKVAKGAIGVNLGRNIWQNDYPVAMIRAIRALIHENATPKEAQEIYDNIKSGK